MVGILFINYGYIFYDCNYVYNIYGEFVNIGYIKLLYYNRVGVRNYYFLMNLENNCVIFVIKKVMFIGFDN